jgi:hypothetical protein
MGATPLWPSRPSILALPQLEIIWVTKCDPKPDSFIFFPSQVVVGSLRKYEAIAEKRR